MPEYIRKTESHVLIGWRILNLPSLANQRICLIVHEYIPEYIQLVKSDPGRNFAYVTPGKVIWGQKFLVIIFDWNEIETCGGF